jgi:hypothetical protein
MVELRHGLTLADAPPQMGAMSHSRFAFAHPYEPAAARVLRAGQGGGPLRDNVFFREPVTSNGVQYALYMDGMPLSFRWAGHARTRTRTARGPCRLRCQACAWAAPQPRAAPRGVLQAGGPGRG